MIYKLFLREFKFYKTQQFFLILTLVLGILGLLSIFLLGQSVKNAMKNSAKEMLGADLVVYSRREITEEEKKILFNSFPETQMHEFYELYSMVKSHHSRLVLIKAYPTGFPFYGSIKTKNNQPLDEDTIYLSQDSYEQLGANNIKQISIGDKIIHHHDIILDSSTYSFRGVNLAPVVLVNKKIIEKTNLIQFGSTVTRGFAFKGTISEETLQKAEKSLVDPGISFVRPDKSNEQVTRIFNYLSDYLGLAALTGFLLSILTTFYFFESREIQNLKTTGALELMGVPNKTLKRKFYFNIFVVYTFSFLLSFALYYIFQASVLDFVRGFLPFHLELELKFIDIILIYTLTLVLIMTLIYPLILKISQIKAMDKISSIPQLNWSFKDVFVFLPFSSVFVLATMYFSRSIKVGGIFSLSLIISTLALVLFFHLYVEVIKKIRFHSLKFLFASRYFVRNKSQIILTFVALSLGLTLLLVIINIEHSLKYEVFMNADKQASLFIFDIQEEEFASLEKDLKQLKAPIQVSSPMIRAKIITHNGQKFAKDLVDGGFETREREDQRRFKNRMVNLSYKPKLNSTEEIIAGHEFDLIYKENSPIYISLEERYAERMGFKLGDEIGFDIMGITIVGVVKNLRSVKWTSFSPNFFIIFADGVINDAPKTYLMSLGKMDDQLKLQIQNFIVDKYNHISVISIKELVAKIYAMIQMMGDCLKLVGAFSLLIGFILLIVITLESLQIRKQDFELFKFIGLRKKVLNQIILIEFMLLITLCSFSAVFISLFVSQMFGYYIFDTILVYNFIDTLKFIFIFMIVGLLIIKFSLHNFISNK